MNLNVINYGRMSLAQRQLSVEWPRRLSSPQVWEVFLASSHAPPAPYLLRPPITRIWPFCWGRRVGSPEARQGFCFPREFFAFLRLCPLSQPCAWMKPLIYPPHWVTPSWPRREREEWGQESGKTQSKLSLHGFCPRQGNGQDPGCLDWQNQSRCEGEG